MSPSFATRPSLIHVSGKLASEASLDVAYSCDLVRLNLSGPYRPDIKLPRPKL